jgi:uncharacterized membrane protein
MTKMYAFSATAKAVAFAVAFVLFAPVAIATLMQAAQIVA